MSMGRGEVGEVAVEGGRGVQEGPKGGAGVTVVGGVGVVVRDSEGVERGDSQGISNNESFCR